ncbi:hypothetical protein Q604_UNBC16884G0001, partial [human gut metagenome]
TPEVQNAVREYQDSVKEFVAEARNYIIINSSYGEAYTQLFTKYNKMIGKANSLCCYEIYLYKVNRIFPLFSLILSHAFVI